MSRRPRVKVPSPARPGDVIEIKTLISHRMETGQRKDAQTGALIPRDIINSFVAKFNGQEVFRTTLYPAIAANPYVAFRMKVAEPGVFEFIWTDDHGTVTTATETLDVE